jgi:hypothetical protein
MVGFLYVEHKGEMSNLWDDFLALTTIVLDIKNLSAVLL